MTEPRLCIGIGSILGAAEVALISQANPGFEVLYRPDLQPTSRWTTDHAGDPGFTRSAAQQAEFWDLLMRAEVLLGIPDESPRLLAETVAANPRLRWVHTFASGGGAQVRAARLTEADLQRVVFTTSAGVHAEPLAEYALFAALSGLKHLPRLLANKAAGHWGLKWEMGQLRGSTVLVVGLGAVGRTCAVKFSTLGARVLGVSRSGRACPQVERVFAPGDLRAALGLADVIVSILPSTAVTAGVFDAAAFAACKPGAIFVNLGRGNSVDEPALLAALQSGQLSWAAIDVAAREPLPADSPLWQAENLLISPHTAAVTAVEDRMITELFIRNAEALMAGRELENVMDTHEFY